MTGVMAELIPTNKRGNASNHLYQDITCCDGTLALLLSSSFYMHIIYV